MPPILSGALLLATTLAFSPAQAALTSDFTATFAPAETLQLAQAESEDRRERRGVPPGFEAAAETLGVSVRDLMEALRASGGPPPNLENTAATLGVTVEELRSALPERPRRQD